MALCTRITCLAGASILTGRTPNRVCMWDYINRNTHMHLPHNEFTLGHAANWVGKNTGGPYKTRLVCVFNAIYTFL